MPLLARGLTQAGVQVTIATTDDDGPGTHLAVPLGKPLKRAEATYFYFRRQTNFYKFSWPLTRWLARHIQEFDLVHIHALFSYSSVATARLARWKCVPYVIRPLGVLNRWGMENRRRWQKKFSLRCLELPTLRGAASIHYTSRQEQDQAVHTAPEIAGLPSAVIPLGIDTAAVGQSADAERFYARFPQTAGRTLILFLSRLDPKKGIDLLLPAFAETRRQAPESMLVIAGDGEESFVGNLRATAKKLSIRANDLLWTGFLAGVDKAAALAAARIFVLPSYSENFGIAAAEALAAGVPSILSDQVAISDEAVAADAALVVPCQAPALANALRQLLTEPEIRARLGVNASRLAAEKFSLQAVGGALVQLYRSILQTSQVS